MGREIIGVLGGMGPQATCDLFQKIINATAAKKDQDHLHIVIDNNPGVPDRNGFIMGQGDDPTDILVQGARRLAQAGCSFIVIPCNTAHFFAPAIEQAAGIPVLNMIDNVAKVAASMLPTGSIVGLLATNGTIASHLYHNAVNREGLQLIAPVGEEQAKLMQLIFGADGVKAGFTDESVRQKARQVAEGLISQGAQLIIAGCTEIPLVLSDGDISVPVLDSTGLLAKAAVQRAL